MAWPSTSRRLSKQTPFLRNKLGTKGGATAIFLANGASDPDAVGAAAVHGTRVIGHLLLAYLWTQVARVAFARHDRGEGFDATRRALRGGGKAWCDLDRLPGLESSLAELLHASGRW
ncbi:acyl-CoA dehydrogenase C-terminal domain-containing protein [Paraburkholderia sediminicola]|uniref:acyl-CoA dehydrogenase C-terminal domain-containing protein n=1 Tax=Paraburkholderia sediminicola TaxID=458836 RepID=UPI000BE40179